MNDLLNSRTIYRLSNNLYPKLSLSEEYIEAVIQILTPYHDLFDKADWYKSLEMINTYFTPRIGFSILEDIKKPDQDQTDPPTTYQAKIIKILILEVLALSGRSCSDRKRNIIQVYDLYYGISLDDELSLMFSEWLLPVWILRNVHTYIINKFGMDSARELLLPSPSDVKKMCQDITGLARYDHKMDICISNLLTGCIAINKFEKQGREYFEKLFGTTMTDNTGLDYQDEILRRLLLRHIVDGKFGFVNLLHAIKDNTMLPGFDTILKLL